MEIWATEGAEGPPHLPWSVEGAEGQGRPYLVPKLARTGFQGSGSGGAGWLSAWHRLDREVATPWRIQCRCKMWQTRSRYRKARTIDERFPGLATWLHCQVRPGPVSGDELHRHFGAVGPFRGPSGPQRGPSGPQGVGGATLSPQSGNSPTETCRRGDYFD